MLVKILMYVSEKFFCWRHMYYHSKVSPTYRKLFTNIIHQHTFKFLFKIFTNIQYFSPTYRKVFTNILHQHTFNFLFHQHTASPTYRKTFTNILFFTNIFHQHHYSLFEPLKRCTKNGFSRIFKSHDKNLF